MRKGRLPFRVSVPAHVVSMRMCEDHDIDVTRFNARRPQISREHAGIGPEINCSQPGVHQYTVFAGPDRQAV